MLVSKTQLSDLTGIAARTLTKRLDGFPSKKGPRNALLYESRAVLAHLYGGGSDGEATSYDAERTRLTKAQADHEELKVQTLDGSLIPADVVKQTWTDMVLAMRAKLLGLPTRIGPKVMSATNLREVEEFAREEIYSALNELSGANRGHRYDGAFVAETAAEADGQRMGAN